MSFMSDEEPKPLGSLTYQPILFINGRPVYHEYEVYEYLNSLLFAKTFDDEWEMYRAYDDEILHKGLKFIREKYRGDYQITRVSGRFSEYASPLLVMLIYDLDVIEVTSDCHGVIKLTPKRVKDICLIRRGVDFFFKTTSIANFAVINSKYTHQNVHAFYKGIETLNEVYQFLPCPTVEPFSFKEKLLLNAKKLMKAVF
ncbi:MAG: hypothetical protein SNJ55_08695 [Chloroherpetonaceae bacterium]